MSLTQAVVCRLFPLLLLNAFGFYYAGRYGYDLIQKCQAANEASALHQEAKAARDRVRTREDDHLQRQVDELQEKIEGRRPLEV